MPSSHTASLCKRPGQHIVCLTPQPSGPLQVLVIIAVVVVGCLVQPAPRAPGPGSGMLTPGTKLKEDFPLSKHTHFLSLRSWELPREEEGEGVPARVLETLSNGQGSLCPALPRDGCSLLQGEPQMWEERIS